jgi:hypothetical protein
MFIKLSKEKSDQDRNKTPHAECLLLLVMSHGRNNLPLFLLFLTLDRKRGMVYEKTASGIDEITGSDRQLAPKQRQVLILIDGKRSLHDIASALPRLAVSDIMQELEAQGFIRDPKAGNVKVFTKQTDAPIFISEEKMAQTKQLLITSTTEHLGLMGRTMNEQISSATSYEQLRTCISRWHMAIRETKGGRMIADELMSKVQMTLASQ